MLPRALSAFPASSLLSYLPAQYNYNDLAIARILVQVAEVVPLHSQRLCIHLRLRLLLLRVAPPMLHLINSFSERFLNMDEWFYIVYVDHKLY